MVYFRPLLQNVIAEPDQRGRGQHHCVGRQLGIQKIMSACPLCRVHQLITHYLGSLNCESPTAEDTIASIGGAPVSGLPTGEPQQS